MRYADDTVLLPDSIEGLQILIDQVTNACNHYNMKLNVKKAKIMIISKNHNINGNIRVAGSLLERVTTFKYLGCTINANRTTHNKSK